jgi:hypothetical protein
MSKSIDRLPNWVRVALQGLRRLLTSIMAGFRRLLWPVLGGFLAYLLIPIALSGYNETRALREARLARAVKFGDRNAEFVSKIHAQATLLSMFAHHNDRMNVAGTELKDARKELYESYKKGYLEIDTTEWWWPWEFEREVRALNLLSADELGQLHAYVNDYSESAKATIYQPIYLWHFLDSPKYKVREKNSQAEIEKLRNTMDSVFKPEDEKRADLVQKIAALFAQSNHRTAWNDIVGISW